MVEQLIDDFYHSIQADRIKYAVDALRHHIPGLLAGDPYDLKLRDMLLDISFEELFAPESVKDSDRAQAVAGGLLLWNDCNEDAHSIAQHLSSPEGSYIHAIVHRREPDIGNSGYWFRKTGRHPIFSLLQDYVSASMADGYKNQILEGNQWDPEKFNKLVGKAQTTAQSEDRALIELQHMELMYLIAHSYRHTIGT